MIDVWHRRDIGWKLLGVAESFMGFNMAMIFDFLHIVEKHSCSVWDQDYLTVQVHHLFQQLCFSSK